MFGAVCSGRPIQLANQVETTKYVIAIPNSSNVNYVTVFLLPQTEFTDSNFTALVYFQLPNSTKFKLLGGLNPLKPSAIYKINNNDNSKQNATQLDDIDMNDSANAASTINIGISIEPTPQAEALLAEAKSNVSALTPVPLKPTSGNTKNPQDTAFLANQIVTHAYNYLSGFVDATGKVPMKAFDTWWEKFKNRLVSNPNFLDELKN